MIIKAVFVKNSERNWDKTVLRKNQFYITNIYLQKNCFLLNILNQMLYLIWTNNTKDNSINSETMTYLGKAKTTV